MTGFARTQGASSTLSWSIEIRSVNGRGLDLRFKLPSPFDALEPEFRLRAQKRLFRGNVQVGLSYKREAAALESRVNEQVFLAYAEAAESLAWKAKLAAATTGDLMRLPGVIETADTGELVLDEACQRDVLRCFDDALDQLIASRQSEGTALARIVSMQVDAMGERVAEAKTADAARHDAIKARLETQIAALLGTSGSFDPDRLHQEAVLIASRIDVREEMDRLLAHIEQARAHLVSKEPVGRKLDFLSQEFVREANTLCSKANDIALTRIGLDLKAIVEQFREQVQNIE